MSTTVAPHVSVDFELPPGAEADAPPERRGLTRDGVKLLTASQNGVAHGVFRDLAQLLQPGDMLVVNTSATLPAAVDGRRASGARGPVHVATELDDGTWVIELRAGDNSGPQLDGAPGEIVELTGSQRVTLLEPFPAATHVRSRLWRAAPDPARRRTTYLHDHGRPIRYRHLSKPWPLGDLQNVFADEPGSAEMASAGRPITQRVLTDLVRRGVVVAPIVLHTGVSSPEKHEPPMPEPFRVPAPTARLVNAVRAGGGRIVAVGTTVTRALESAVDSTDVLVPTSGWTRLVLGPRRPARIVTGLVSGLHEPGASHLALLEAVAGPALVSEAYRSAVAERYLWHEFGDSMLFLP